jgi:hypothetical protein
VLVSGHSAQRSLPSGRDLALGKLFFIIKKIYVVVIARTAVRTRRRRHRRSGTVLLLLRSLFDEFSDYNKFN